jgi:hypothetical protein
MYILYIVTMTLTNDRPVLPSERAPHEDKTITVKLNLISGHELQNGARHQDGLD